MVAILHNIRSLHNVGSIFRTADAAGLEKLYLTGVTPAPVDRFGHLRPQLGKVALGAQEYVPWEKVASPTRAIRSLKERDFSIVGVEQTQKAVPYYSFPKARDRKRLAILLGNERRGLPASLLQKCDTILVIPMRGKKESLNVSVVFGIVVFHLLHG